ncbi:hypothetical protein LTR66_007583 [Elasticomyces elasticus]|nr:hypothetical protein LTR66_007583 [Elasticomyces elasticus]KAK4987655.1 hypothetical protein LTR50_004498 [Elasticomyces elasticus]
MEVEVIATHATGELMAVAKEDVPEHQIEDTVTVATTTAVAEMTVGSIATATATTVGHEETTHASEDDRETGLH